MMFGTAVFREIQPRARRLIRTAGQEPPRPTISRTPMILEFKRRLDDSFDGYRGAVRASADPGARLLLLRQVSIWSRSRQDDGGVGNAELSWSLAGVRASSSCSSWWLRSLISSDASAPTTHTTAVIANISPYCMV
jgi:hypothetical protein